ERRPQRRPGRRPRWRAKRGSRRGSRWSRMRVGWLGLGATGGPMAAAAVPAAHQANRSGVAPQRVASLGAARGRAARSPREAVRGAEVAVVMVATAAQAEAALSGPEGAEAGLAPGSVLVVTATLGPAAVTGLADRLRERGVALVDAPVSGGVARAAAGDLLIMVSGEPDAVARVTPLLDALARQAPVIGSQPGDGQRLKLVNQLLCGVHIAAAAEALAFAEAIGLD